MSNHLNAVDCDSDVLVMCYVSFLKVTLDFGYNITLTSQTKTHSFVHYFITFRSVHNPVLRAYFIFENTQ